MKYLALLSLLITCLSSPSCVGIKKEGDEIKPEPVEWYVVNLIGYDRKSGEAAFDYMDSAMMAKRTKPTRHALSKSKTPMIHTLANINKEYSNNSDEMEVLAWNDKPPGENAASNYAHSKGFLAFDKKKGLLMNHSLPQFPISGDQLFKEEFGSNFGKYMQHFYCENYNKSALSTIFEALKVIKPNVYKDLPLGNFDGFKSTVMKDESKEKSTKIFKITKRSESWTKLSLDQTATQGVKKVIDSKQNKSSAKTKSQNVKLSKQNKYS